MVYFAAEYSHQTLACANFFCGKMPTPRFLASQRSICECGPSILFSGNDYECNQGGTDRRVNRNVQTEIDKAMNCHGDYSDDCADSDGALKRVRARKRASRDAREGRDKPERESQADYTPARH